MRRYPYELPLLGRRGVVINLLAVPVIVLIGEVAARAIGGPSSPSWEHTVKVVIGLEYGILSLAAFLLAPPRPHGRRAAGTMVMRIPPWRRLTFASTLPVSLAVLRAEDILRGDVSLGAVAGVLAAIASVFAVTTDRIEVSPEGIARVAGIGRRQSIAWSEISDLVIFAAGINVQGPRGSTIRVPGLWMDGYPELIRMVLERAPRELLDSIRDESREQLKAIADLADPGGAAHRRPNPEA